MLSRENYAVRVTAFQGQDVEIVMSDVNSFIAEREGAGCCIADVKASEAMASKTEVSEYETELYYRSCTVYVIYLEPVS